MVKLTEGKYNFLPRIEVSGRHFSETGKYLIGDRIKIIAEGRVQHLSESPDDAKIGAIPNKQTKNSIPKKKYIVASVEIDEMEVEKTKKGDNLSKALAGE